MRLRNFTVWDFWEPPRFFERVEDILEGGEYIGYQYVKYRFVDFVLKKGRTGATYTRCGD